MENIEIFTTSTEYSKLLESLQESYNNYSPLFSILELVIIKEWYVNGVHRLK